MGSGAGKNSKLKWGKNKNYELMAFSVVEIVKNDNLCRGHNWISFPSSSSVGLKIVKHKSERMETRRHRETKKKFQP